MAILTKLLTVIIWIGISTLLLLINRIARFYQLTTGVRSHYSLFLLPVVLFLGGMIRYLAVDSSFAGDVVGDTLFFLGGVCLFLMSYYLLKLMTGGR